MKLKISYDSMSDVPSEFKESFKEVDGKAVLSSAIEVKTDADVQAVLDAKGHIKAELTEAKEKLKSLDGVTVDEFKKQQDELDILRAKVKDGGQDEEVIKSIVDAKVARATEELTKQNSELSGKLDDANGFRFKTEKDSQLVAALKGKVSDAVTLDAQQIIGGAMERQADGSYISNGSMGFDKGLSFEQIVSKATEARQHWLPTNTAGGATGNSSNTPTDKRTELNTLLKKQHDGNATRQEVVQMSELANEIKSEEN